MKVTFHFVCFVRKRNRIVDNIQKNKTEKRRMDFVDGVFFVVFIQFVNNNNVESRSNITA